MKIYEGAIETIPIAPINLLNQKPTDVKFSQLTLHHDYLLYSFSFLASEPQVDTEGEALRDLPWIENVRNCADLMHFKKHILGLDVERIHNAWKVTVNCNAKRDDIKLYFSHKKEAYEVRDKIFNWLTLKENENENTTVISCNHASDEPE
jgi:hypothetical protein